MNKELINVTNLMKLSRRSISVDEVALVDEIEKLHRFVRIFGLEKTRVYYAIDGKEEETCADMLSERRRAIVVTILALMGHSTTDALFGVKGRVEKNLDDIKGIDNCLSVRDFLDIYLKN